MERKRLARSLSLVAPLVLWHGAVSAGVISHTVLPPPAVIGERTLALLGEATFVDHVLLTLRRTALASFFASTFGTLIGFAMAVNRQIRGVLSPVISALFALPVISMFPLLILILGSTEAALVFTAGIGSFILVVWNARNGAIAIDPAYVDVAYNNGATSRIALLREVWIPGSLPLLFVGIRLGLSMSLLIVTAVEFVVGNDGLGYVMWISWQAYKLPDMYATLVVIGAFGITFTYGLDFLKTKFVPWDTHEDGPVLVP